MAMRPNQRGFTLVEIMIVVAIIGLLAAIAIPNLLRAKINANEGAIKRELRTFSSANESYRAVQIPLSYADGIATLTAAVPPYLDSTWTINPVFGFNLSYAAGNTSYGLVATPASSNEAKNIYCVDHTGIIVASSSGLSGSSSGCAGGLPIN